MMGVIEMVIIVGAIAAFAFMKRTSSTPVLAAASPIPRFSLPPVRAIAWSWLAPTAVMVLFIALSGRARFDGHRVSSQDFGPIRPGSTMHRRLVVQNPPAVPSVPGESVSALSPTTIAPDWIHSGASSVGQVESTVLSSQLWSTEAEAIQELQARAVAMVKEDFERRNPKRLGRPDLGLFRDEQIAEIVVKNRYMERVEKDFGTFTAPMCRLWYQVEISPIVRTELYPAWKSAEVGNRIILVGAGLALLTLLANATALFGHLKTTPNRRSLYAAKIAAISASAWIAGDAFIVAQLLQ